MGAVSSIAGVSNLVAIGDSSVSLAATTKALLSADDKIQGIDGLIFSLPESESLSLKAQITDHFVEDNSAMQDHIAISPITVTLSGKVAEVVLERSVQQQYIQQVLTTLSSLSSIAPGLSQSASKVLLDAQRAKNAIDGTLARYKNAADLFTDTSITNKQKAYYAKIKQMFDGRGVYTVETPWANLKNMAIESVNFEQDESTKDWSTISVTLKQIQFAKTKTVTGQLKGRITYQKAPVEAKGKSKGESVAVSIGKYFGVLQ
jgi:hypothetical protein